MKKGTLSKLILGFITIIALSGLVQCSKNGSSPDYSGAFQTKAVTLTEVTGFGSNPGSLKMWKYVPSGLGTNAPLVVAIHGCAQDAATYAKDTEWHKLADEYKFSVVFPETNSSNNATKCWNFFETGDQNRGGGEALSIKQMVDKMKTDHGTDATRVYVTGLSSGGAFTTVMAAAYPDVFAGAAPMAGIAYKCATDMTGGFNCMNGSVTKTGAQWATLIKGGYSGYTGQHPKISIWQGASDSTVKPVNATEIMKGYANIFGLSETPTQTETIQGSTHKIWKNASGQVLIEIWEIAGMAHGITVDPDGTGGKSGGATDSYALDKNIWSSYMAAKFFGLDNTDKTAPTVSITAPANGATVSGNVTISASASDNVGVTKVEIYIDGTLKATASSYSWDSSQAANGNHTIVAKAYDAAGNIGQATISLTVTGGVQDTQAPTVSITSPANGASVSGSVVISANANDNFGVTKVEFYVDGTLKATATASPYNYTLDASTLADGSHTILVKAYDAANNIGSAQISITSSQLVYSDAISATSTNHYLASRITNSQYLDLGNGTNNTGINPGKIKYGYINAFYLYKLKSTGAWVTDQQIPASQKK